MVSRVCRDETASKMVRSRVYYEAMRNFTALLLSVLAMLASLRTNAQVTSNVFERVLNIRVNAGTNQEATATAFTVDVDGREYLITAKHVVQGLRNRDKIDVFMDGGWTSLAVDIFRCDDPIDIVVIVPPHQLTVNFELPVDTSGVFDGQDAYFLGFPYGIQASGSGVNGPYPMAMVKRGTLSGEVVLDAGKKAILVFLDGYNNPGFSGAPIVYRDLNQGGVVFKLVGVVSGFIPEVVPVMKEHPIASPANAGDAARAQPWMIQKKSDGTYFEYVKNDTYVALNTGIVRGFVMTPAIDLIRQHPIGPEATDKRPTAAIVGNR